MSDLIHIRNSKRDGWDKRSRAHRFGNKPVLALCGAETTHKDPGKPYALHMEKSFRSVLNVAGPRLREYFQSLCPACLQLLVEE